LFQDNKSSILLEKNGKASSSKRTKHINIRYFFITDRVKNEEVSVVWCPTGDMIGEFTTKPLQGVLFRKFRDQIMGVTPARDPVPGKTDSNVGKIKDKPKKAKQNVWYRQEIKREHRSVLGVKPGTAVRSKPGSREKISDPQDLIIFNKAKKMCSRILIRLEGRLKSHPSFTSLLRNNLFRETVFFTFTVSQKTRE
jgi:hypothetical protein